MAADTTEGQSWKLSDFLTGSRKWLEDVAEQDRSVVEILFGIETGQFLLMGDPAVDKQSQVQP